MSTSLSRTNLGIYCLCPCETFLNSFILDSELFVPGYSILRKDWQFLGGGLLMYIKNNINSVDRNEL